MADVQDRDHTGPDAGFSVVRHGFDRSEVRQCIRRLEQTAERAATEREEARTQAAELSGQLEIARREIAALNERLDVLSAPSSGSDDQVRRMLEIARSQGAEITARAQASADHVWSAAEQSSAALRDRYQRLLADLDKQHAEIHATHKSIMKSAGAQVHAMTTAADQRRREVDEQAEQERIRIDREFSESMTVARENLRQELETARAAGAREAEQRAREATEQGERRLATANRQIEQLTRLRDQLAGRLRGTQELLEQTATLLQPSEQEIELADENLLVPPVKADSVPPQRLPAVTDQPAKS